MLFFVVTKWIITKPCQFFFDGRRVLFLTGCFDVSWRVSVLDDKKEPWHSTALFINKILNRLIIPKNFW